MNSDLAYRPKDLLRFVDCLGGALVPGTDAVVYVANTLDGSTASDTIPRIPAAMPAPSWTRRTMYPSLG